MRTNFNVLEANLDKLGMLVLDENEVMETNGGIAHYEWVDGKLIWVLD